MSNVLGNFGPGSGHQGDSLVSNEENAIAFGLTSGLQSYDKFGGLPGRKSVRSVMREFTEKMSKDPLFANVRISEDHPQDKMQLPAITWELDARQPGIEGKGRKNPQLRETYPREDGTILQKWVQDHTFQISFHSVGVSNDQSGFLSDELEFWLMANADLAGQAGVTGINFTGEEKPKDRKFGDSQFFKEHIIHYNCTMEYVYPITIQSVTSIMSWHTSPDSDLKLTTTPIYRNNTNPPKAYDLVPISGPAILLAVHDRADRISVDYLYNVDYVLYVDRTEFATTVSVHWLPRGKRPAAESTYYVSTFLPLLDIPASTTVSTEATTDSGLGSLGVLPEYNKSTRRQRRFRPPLTARVLGGAVDLDNSWESSNNYSALNNNSQLSKTPAMAGSYQEALSRAQHDVISVLDPSASPLTLDEGRAYLPTDSTVGL